MSRRASRRRATHPDLGQRLPELVDQRAFHLLDHLGQRRVEAEAGLDRDGQQVERVGQLQDHVHRARPNPAAQPELGTDEAERRRHPARTRSRARASPSSQAEEEDQDRANDGGQDLDAHPVGAAQAAGIAGLLQLGVGAGDHAALVAAAADAREALDQSAAARARRTAAAARTPRASWAGRPAAPGAPGRHPLAGAAATPMVMSRTAAAARPAMISSVGIGLHLDVDDAADQHVANAHADEADDEEDDAGRQAEDRRRRVCSMRPM